MRRLLYTGLAATLLAGCNDDPVAPNSAPCATFLTSYTAVSGDTVTTTNGVRYFDVEVGSGGEAAAGDLIEVNYSGYLTDGEPFDSSCPDHRPFLEVRLGQGELIPGFEIGVRGMRHQGVRRVIVPSDQAYPAGTVDRFGNPHPLAGDDLIFDIQLLTLL